MSGGVALRKVRSQTPLRLPSLSTSALANNTILTVSLKMLEIDSFTR
jgi:hypothetical protein